MFTKTTGGRSAEGQGQVGNGQDKPLPLLVCVDRIRYSIGTQKTSRKGSQKRMAGVWHPVRRQGTGGIVQSNRASRLFLSIAIGLAIALILVIIEVGVFWLAAGSGRHFAALLASILHVAGWSIAVFLLLEWGIAALLVWLAQRPLAIRRYVRDARGELEDYRRGSTWLAALTDAYPTSVIYQAQASAASAQTLHLFDLARTSNTSYLLAGESGAGKTLALRLNQQAVLSSRSIGRQQPIPVYISLRDYGLFIKACQRLMNTEDAPNVTLLDFLAQDQAGAARHLLPYLRRLMEGGRIFFLCDGLDEVDRDVRPTVASTLAEMLLMTQNRLIVTCRALDYREQQAIARLVDDQLIDLALIEPMALVEVREFVERYIESQGDHWRHTAGQIMQVIEQSRLSYFCHTPLLLYIFLNVIDRVGIQHGQTLDSRGRLLQEYVSHMMKLEKPGQVTKTPLPPEQGNTAGLETLGLIAFELRRAGGVDAMLVPESASGGLSGEALRTWMILRSHAEEQDEPSTFSTPVQIAQRAGLLDISQIGAGNEVVLGYRHPLLADYSIAVYLLSKSLDTQSAFDQIFTTALAHIEDWCVALALWAGLSDDPAQLAERLTAWGLEREDISPVSLLVASLICVSVGWKSPQVGAQRELIVPRHVTELLTRIATNPVDSGRFAQLFTRCIAEGAWELSYSLLPVVSVEGADNLFPLLDHTTVPDLLFQYLCDVVDLPAYDFQVRRTCRILASYGAAVVPRASELSQPGVQRSVRLRTAAINILGGAFEASAVEPLIACLGDASQYVVTAAIHALARLGSELSLDVLLQALALRLPDPSVVKVHLGILAVLERFLVAKQTMPQGETYRRIVQAIIPVLGIDYAAEPAVQQQASDLLVRQCSLPQTHSDSHIVIEAVVSMLLPYIGSSDDALARGIGMALCKIGPDALPHLAAALGQQPPLPEIVRVRLVELLKDLHDPAALPALLRCVADPSPPVQQQLAAALRSYAPASIPGLIDLSLTAADFSVAERAAQIIASMGSEAVELVARALFPLVPARTRLLVEVLAHAQDSRAILPLVNLLKTLRDMDTSQEGITSSDLMLLSVTVIRVLGQFADRQVVAPLIQAVSFRPVQLYEEAIDALSRLGSIAFDGLLAALDVSEETVMTQRLRRALLGMMPFPGEALIAAFRGCSVDQARQIMLTLQAQGVEAAQLLVQHLFDTDTRTRQFVYSTIVEMPGAVVVPPLLEALDRSTWRNAVTLLLLNYKEAIPPLVDVLGDPDRATIAMKILPRFGPEMLSPLVPALDDERLTVQEYAQHILVLFAQQNTSYVVEIVRLFATTLPLRAHESLIEVLTTDLADVSIPALLESLEDAHLVADAAEALSRLAHKHDWQPIVISRLLDALRMEARRRGAETALIRIGAPAVNSVGALITDPDQQVADSAQLILREIGASALPYIWAAHSDTTNPARRAAAMRVFQSMPTDDIRDALVQLVSSSRAGDMATALALMVERINDEKSLPATTQEMIPALLEYVQVHEQEPASLRILAMLLLFGGEPVVKHLSREVSDHPEHHELLAYAFLFLGDEARSTLASMVNDVNAEPEVRAEAMAMLGLLRPTPDVFDYAQSMSKHGLYARQTSMVSAEQLSIALRALGSLLASGTWDVQTLQNMRRMNTPGSAQEELFSILLGWRNEPELETLRKNLEQERESHKSELMRLTDRLVQDQDRIHELERVLLRIQHEHGLRGDELHQITQEREGIREQLERSEYDKDALQEQNEQLRAYNAQLMHELDQLRASQNI